MAAVAHRKPAVSFDPVAQAGTTTLNILREFPDVARNVKPGVIDRLESNIIALSPALSAAVVAKVEGEAATKDERSAAGGLYESLMGLRGSLVEAGVPVETRHRFGLKLTPRIKSTQSVLDAAEAMVAGARKNRKLAAELGITPDVVKDLEEDIASVRSFDQTQKKAKAKKPAKTRARNVIANEIISDIKAIVAVALVRYRKDKVIKDRFLALVPRTPRKKATEKKAEAKKAAEKKAE